MRRKGKLYVILSLILVVGLMIVGYAAYNQHLSISETSKIDSNFNILITNIETKEVGGEAINESDPTYNGLEANFNITFNKKNDYIEYNVEVSNKGSIEAYLNQIKIENANSKVVNMSYRDINIGEELLVGESKTFVVRIEYKGGSGSGEITLNLDYSADNNPGEIIVPEENYKVIYNTEENGGEKGEIKEKNYKKGEEIDLRNVGKKEGYTFVGWNINKESKEAIKTLQMGEEEITLYAIYKKEIEARYKIGDGIKEIPIEKETCEIYNKEETCKINLPNIESIKAKEGRVIDGWYKDNTKVENNSQIIRENSIYEIKAYPDIPANIEINTSTLSNSIRVVTNVINIEEVKGIERYEYSIDNSEYIESNNTYTFDNLEHNTEHTIKVRVTTKGNIQTEKEITVRTLEIATPTFIEEIEGVVKITYPSECEDRYTCTYIKDNGEETAITKNPEEVIFGASGTIIAKVTDGTNYITSSTYTVVNVGKDINYTGEEQEFIAPYSGYYKIELWGAGGGIPYASAFSGKGAYTSGEIYLNKNDVLYSYVGKQGTDRDSCNSSEVFNRGAANDIINDRCGAGGGGATDIRLKNGAWNNESSLRSRIMVAAGGTYGADGGDLEGKEALDTETYYENFGKKAFQTKGGEAPTKFWNAYSNGTAGGFGYAGHGGAINEAGSNINGGGGSSGSSGYYGGSGASGLVNGSFQGGSGSSYISGYAGVNSITSETSGTHTNQTKHYSGKYFINTEMLAGQNTGNGKVRITYLGDSSNDDSKKFIGIRYIRNCTTGNQSNGQSDWVEMQAISHGTNVARGKTVSATNDGVSTTAYADRYAFSYLVDGRIDNISSSSGYTFLGNTGKNQCVTIDLESEYDLEEVAVWHYYRSGNIFNNNITYVAKSDSVFKIIDSSTYAETSAGHHIKKYN